jgi:hypothetical protein
MAKEELEIEISASGKVTVRTIGIKGARCLDVAEVVTGIVGREEDRQLTTEYHESETSVDQHLDIHQRHR